MIDLKKFKGVAISQKDNSPEAKKIMDYFLYNNLPICYLKFDEELPKGYFPSGSVEWCLKLLGHHVKPDYYPHWITPFLYRDVWEADKWPLKQKVFIKPSDKYKRFDGKRTTGTYKGKKKGPYWCSDIVSFIDEWRYYVADGKVLCGHWYQGEGASLIETPKTPSVTGVSIPDYYCGCLDFGRLNTGELALVEAQHPFACGWYGDDIELYIQWLMAGWGYMQSYSDNK